MLPNTAQGAMLLGRTCLGFWFKFPPILYERLVSGQKTICVATDLHIDVLAF